ncbi:MAG: cysteine--tRNA ligase [Chrysiogenetes bacterium]|nr:cysteine--tRNA ligase [Chrysiogenetes bacterium]
MALRLYNTLTRKEEDFEPLHEGKVGMYACGVTVYDRVHVGHARSAVVYDVIFRYLKYKGYDVTFVRNFTDVDDKIIKRANEEGATSEEIAERYIAAYHEDMGPLNLQPPTIEPKATEHMAQIIKLIERLIEKGAAYESGGDVFFAVKKFDGYGKLSGKDIDELESGARIDINELKENPMDFALWKSAKPGEPAWDSPWGKGRPGWHIECSAMSMSHLGESFDIHGGGNDLVFPHHENEIAQSEGATGHHYAKYWIHNGMVVLNKQKMSKSTGNFFTLRDVLEKYHPEVLRTFILGTQYRKPIDFAEDYVRDAESGLRKLYETIRACERILEQECPNMKGPAEPTEEETALLERLAALPAEFEEKMDNDFDSAGALGRVQALRGEVNGYLFAHNFECTPVSCKICRGFLNALDLPRKVLGILSRPAEEFLAELEARVADEAEISPAEIEKLIADRNAARTGKNYAEADRIRDELAAHNVEIKDGPGGTEWRWRT